MLKIKSIFKKIGKMFVFLIKTIQFLTFATIIASAIFLWQRPQYLIDYLKIENKAPETYKKDDISLQNSQKIEDLRQKIESIESVSKIVTENAVLLKQQFTYFDKAKADAAEILSISNKIDTIRNKVDKIGSASNSGALILTSAILIRDNISQGLSCKNEVEALKILAENIDNMNQDIEFIYTHANMDFYSQSEIIRRFDEIYGNLEKSLNPQKDIDWKQRLISKINEYVKISTPQDKENEKEEKYNPLKSLKVVKDLVDKGDLTAASRLLKDDKNSDLFDIAEIKDWYDQIENQMNFYQSLSNIIAQSLLIMKVEDAKEKPLQ